MLFSVYDRFCSAKARHLPPDVIIFQEYDPSEDMDQKITRKKKAKRGLEDAAATTAEEPVPKSTRRCSTPAADTTLPSPPDSPPSPQFEPVSSADVTAYPGVPLRSLPSGFVIHG